METAIKKVIDIIKYKTQKNDILSILLLSDGEDNDP